MSKREQDLSNGLDAEQARVRQHLRHLLAKRKPAPESSQELLHIAFRRHRRVVEAIRAHRETSQEARPPA